MIHELDQQYNYVINWTFETFTSAALVCIASILVLRLVLNWRAAAVIAFIKVAIVMLYFCFFEDGQWFYGGDDYSYYERGMEFLKSGANPISIMTEPVFDWYFFARTGWALQTYFSYLALYFLDDRYYAPVLALVFWNSLTIVFLVKSVASGQDDNRAAYSFWLAVFLLLHWHTIAWTSFLNLKDPQVALGMSIGLFLITRFRSSRIILGAAFAGLMYSFHWLRFYYPAFFCAPLFFSDAIFRSWRVKLSLALVLSPIVAYMFWTHLHLAIRMSEFGSLFYGLFHFLLQPAPWSITEPATYLLIPAILHWIFVIPTFFGALFLLRRGNREGSQAGVIIVSFFLIGVAFYAAVPAIASTRHRMPLDLLMAVMQFQFLWTVFMSRSNDVVKNRLNALKKSFF